MLNFQTLSECKNEAENNTECCSEQLRVIGMSDLDGHNSVWIEVDTVRPQVDPMVTSSQLDSWLVGMTVV